MVDQILLIDDDPVINFVHSKIVRRKLPDTPLLIFENGLKAMSHLKSNPMNSYLIFLDLNMPELDGWGFLEAISLEAKDIDLQVHIVTSSVDPEDKMKSKNYNQVSSFLVKPLKADDLEDITFIH
ncbi:response regulator [Algoriphagus sp. D3-2-R+10]|uniref:response regulator n=1 Tax=Algoriphagus aurantiacus TaxID=3103948 RepID=UPI002B3CA562|nr:response regulator [Algoriphagus sp. D3-2-R+10]MEB2775573.1 response regulator [Algoriphagus sp. D3-2-R+10]